MYVVIEDEKSIYTNICITCARWCMKKFFWGTSGALAGSLRAIKDWIRYTYI